MGPCSGGLHDLVDCLILDPLGLVLQGDLDGAQLVRFETMAVLGQRLLLCNVDRLLDVLSELEVLEHDSGQAHPQARVHRRA